MDPRTVLIVEDEPLIRMMLADILEDEGYDVIEAGTVLEALAILAARRPDAVITDIDMPGRLNGLDLAAHIAVSQHGLPVIVTSGRHRPANDHLPSTTRFLAKPYDPGHLVKMLAC